MVEKSWKIENIEAFEPEIMLPLDENPTKVLFVGASEFEYGGFKGDLSSWESMGKWIGSLNSGKDVLTPQLKAKVNELVSGLETTEEKTKAIYEYLQKNTRYVSIQLGIGGFMPFEALTVEKYGYGDCKALSNFMGAMLKEAGIKSILALRGDPTGGPSATWTPTPGGFNHADELVQLADEFGGFTIGVAAFPDGHPASNGDFDKDVDVLIRKEELGATFATTQFFFEVKQYTKLVEALAARGSKLVIIPGILPVTNVKLLHRMAELGGTPIPHHIADAFAKVENDPHAVRALGVEIATSLCKDLLAAGAPGLHFYTMNSSTATQEIYRKLNDAQ